MGTEVVTSASMDSMQTAMRFGWLTAAFGLAMILAACAPAPAATPTAPEPTATADPCAPGRVGESIEALHRLTREFDDASALAANTDIRQLATPISALERIQNRVRYAQVPACLVHLQAAQLAFMSRTVDALVAFAGGASDVATLAQGLNDARGLRDQYNLELASAMGLRVPTSTP